MNDWNLQKKTDNKYFSQVVFKNVIAIKQIKEFLKKITDDYHLNLNTVTAA